MAEAQRTGTYLQRFPGSSTPPAEGTESEQLKIIELEESTQMLTIKNLHATVEGTPILKGIDLEIKPGEVHAVMGPNGSGKSTLAQVLAGHEAFEVTEGEVLFDGQNLLDLEVEERALAGLFLAFQYPVEIPGVSNLQFLRTALNTRRKANGQDELDSVSFMKLAKEKAKQVDMSPDFLKRGVNEGFSGGEKKRNEILQMLMLEPRLGILDETDSGLDIDALKVIANGVNSMRSDDRSFIVVTHYQRLLEHIVPDVVHVLAGGKIIKTGGKELALELEEHGYTGLGIDDAEATG
ncbi:Fe-S cluster assembly ATP-binding protein [Halospina denitrificans]|uniref:Fe-S cluster assembly ATP-binding protein n=2 Tax=Halospina denitrificans TaxID=332522 RepID=A0A4R7K0M8_9GAMM|nr:Fe-S cluster assembly ATP-binding protein [Halospina denitrificans]